jgi:hypothetical protein
MALQSIIDRRLAGKNKSVGNRELSAYADRIGRSAMKEDINYVAGWITGQIMAVDGGRSTLRNRG